MADNTGLLILGVIVVFAILVISGFQMPQLAIMTPGLNVTPTPVGATPTPIIIYATPVVTHPNLATLMSPYLLLGNAQANCVAGGGTWTWTAVKTGCEGFAGTIDCSQAVYLAAMTQCNAAGATYTCNAHNIVCKY
jgi:hypothetical protein